MKKLSGIILTAVLVVGILSALMPVMPASAEVVYWDFECHTYDHSWLDQLTDDQIRWQYEQVNAAFIAHGYPPPKHTAYPGGRLDKKGRVKAITAEYRLSGRVVWGEMSTYPITDWYELKAAQLKSNTKIGTIKGWIDQCIATNALLIILTHDVTEKPTSWGTTPTILAQAVDYAVEKQNTGLLWITTIEEAYNYWSTATQGKATCVFTFDDANESDYTNVYTIFKARGVRGTSYIVTSFIDTAGHLTWAQIAQMRAGT
jgi:hypothetical protein